MFHGRALQLDRSLAEQGITSGAEVITVRRKLVPEGDLRSCLVLHASAATSVLSICRSEHNEGLLEVHGLHEAG